MNNSQTSEERPALTNGQKQKMKKYAVFALMGIICAGCMWLIFAPSADDRAKAEATAGFNTDIPLPKEEGLIGDKRDAYEQEQIKQKQAERMRSLEDFNALLGEEARKPSDDLVLLDEEPATRKTSGDYTSQSRAPSSIWQSANAYHDVNRTLGNFYETPKEDSEKERLRQELEELKTRMDESEAKRNLKEEQLEMMEKSFQMASKYMPASAGTPDAPKAEPAENGNKNVSGKTAIISVSQVREQTVSALQQDMSSAEFMEMYAGERNMSFFTAESPAQTETKNTISACIHDDRTVMDGESVRLRLLEPMQVGGTLIPRNTLLTGMAKIGGERLTITVVSLEYQGAIIPVELRVYDTDGQQGIFIPNTQEMNAVKEVAANMGTSAGTSISLTSDAGEQLAADLGRSLIQGTSQFVAKKLREVKVHLKAGYNVFLLPSSSQ